MGKEVDRQIHQTGKCDIRMTGWERFDGVVNLVRVTGTDLIDREHDVSISNTDFSPIIGNDWLTNGQKVWSQSADGFLDNDLKCRTDRQGHGESEDGVGKVEEGSFPDLSDEDDSERDQSCDQTGADGGKDGLDVGVGERGVDNVAALEESDGKESIERMRTHPYLIVSAAADRRERHTAPAIPHVMRIQRISNHVSSKKTLRFVKNRLKTCFSSLTEMVLW